jgi:hypothetical protein
MRAVAISCKKAGAGGRFSIVFAEKIPQKISGGPKASIFCSARVCSKAFLPRGGGKKASQVLSRAELRENSADINVEGAGKVAFAAASKTWEQ